jgi:hypothetical protein
MKDSQIHQQKKNAIDQVLACSYFLQYLLEFCNFLQYFLEKMHYFEVKLDLGHSGYFIICLGRTCKFRRVAPEQIL